MKDDVMLRACMAKFTQHARLRKLLLSTGDAKLVEHTKNDRSDRGRGREREAAEQTIFRFLGKIGNGKVKGGGRSGK